MRNNSFFEKITGSIRLSDDDLNALNEHDDKTENTSKINKSSNTHDDDFEVIEGDDDFEIPEDAEIETIEEIIEDDSIDEEEIEEYYEEIIDEDEEEDVDLSDDEENNNKENDETQKDDDYPVYHLKKDDEKSEVNIYKEDQESLKQIELPVDVFTMHNEVVLRILVPGITPENLKVSITRNHVSLTCTRPSPEGISDTNYFDREIPYGEFTRMIHLPSDVDVEKAEAVEKYGLLIIRLPMLDAKKVQELKIKSV